MEAMNLSLFVCVVLMNTIDIQAANECGPSNDCKTGLLERGKKLLTAVAKDLIHINLKNSDYNGLFGLNIINVEQDEVSDFNVRAGKGKLLRTLRGLGRSGRTAIRNRQLIIIEIDLSILGTIKKGLLGYHYDNEKGLLMRRNTRYPTKAISRVPRRVKHLPKATRNLPGHTLIKPSRGMLKSAAKYPLRDFKGAAVYGNLDNVGITWDKTRNRILYSDFRKKNIKPIGILRYRY